MLVVCLKHETEFYLAVGKVRYLNEVSLVNFTCKSCVWWIRPSGLIWHVVFRSTHTWTGHGTNYIRVGPVNGWSCYFMQMMLWLKLEWRLNYTWLHGSLLLGMWLVLGSPLKRWSSYIGILKYCFKIRLLHFELKINNPLQKGFLVWVQLSPSSTTPDVQIKYVWEKIKYFK